MLKKVLAFAFAFLTVCHFSFAAPSSATGGDPWIYQVYKELYNRQPTAWELNINNYNNGSWNNYNELKQYVKDYQAALSSASLQINVALNPKNKDQALVGININGVQKAVALVSTSDGHVITAGGGNVITAGGANAVAAGGGNAIAVTPAMLGVSFGSRYTVQAAGTKIVPTSGKGALIIR